MENEVHQFYGNKLRVRVCGLCEVNDQLLLINHKGINKTNFWAPPGGGLNFGESTDECLKREYREETGLTIRVEDFLFFCEFIQPPLHAIELFFNIKTTSNELVTGRDPEAGSPSLITEAKFITWKEIKSLPPDQLHGIFRYVDHPSKVSKLRGHFKL
jgi:8-oxo-dGTP diphosphatase